MESFILSLDPLQLSLAATLAVAFLIQLYYYFGPYARIPVYRQKINSKVAAPPVSVVVIIEDDLAFLEETLPKLLQQDYGEYEIVLVDNGSGPEAADMMAALPLHDPRIKTTRINPDPKFPYRRKLILTVGIKACTYPNILLTEADTFPVSDKWLSLMAKGFTDGDVVLGYCGLETRKGFTGRLIRCSRLMMSVRYLSSAMRGRPYRGILNNIGYTSEIYFKNRGYNYLRLNAGDDDLFVQKVADRHNTAIIVNPNATVRQHFSGGWKAWNSERKYYSYAFRFYPFGIKTYIFLELFSRFLFFASAIAVIALQIPYVWWGAAGLILLRYLTVFFTVSRICTRLGEKGLLGAFILHDFLSPLSETLLSLARRMRPSKGLWS